MGALHAGHVSLLEAARARVRLRRDEPVRQRGAVRVRRRLRALPARRGARPRASPKRAGVDVVFAPAADELYPPGFRTWVEPDEHGLEAEFRPGHFRGVATVCLKLFNIVRPRRVYFGQKDAQQVEVVRRMIRDLNLDVELRVLPTVRDADGLALSSRNALLTPEERERALALPRALQTRDASRARELLDGVDVDYVEVADFEPQGARRRRSASARPPDRQRPPGRSRRNERTTRRASCRCPSSPR